MNDHSYPPKNRVEGRDQTDFRELWVTASDLTKLRYTISGQGPVDFLLFDGIGCDGFIWAYLKPYLEETGRVIHLHMRGHGLSHDPADLNRLGIDELIGDWERVIDVESLAGTSEGEGRPLVALGHSMGVQVALELRSRRPDLLWKAMILMCGTFEHTAGNMYNSSMIERVLPLLACRSSGDHLHKLWRRLVTLPLAVHVARATEMSADLTRKRDIESYLGHLGRMRPRVFLAMLNQMSKHSCQAHYGYRYTGFGDWWDARSFYTIETLC